MRGVGVVLGLELVLAPLLLKRAVTAVYGGVLAIDRRESRMCVCSEGLKKISTIEINVVKHIDFNIISLLITCIHKKDVYT